MVATTIKGMDRKINLAFKGMPRLNVSKISHHIPSHNTSVQYEVHFEFEGEFYRFDYEWRIGDTLPRVGVLRAFAWDSMHDYRRRTLSLPNH